MNDETKSSRVANAEAQISAPLTRDATRGRGAARGSPEVDTTSGRAACGSTREAVEDHDLPRGAMCEVCDARGGLERIGVSRGEPMFQCRDRAGCLARLPATNAQHARKGGHA